MLKNGQAYFKNLAVCKPQDFSIKFGHFSTSCIEGQNIKCKCNSFMALQKQLRNCTNRKSNIRVRSLTREHIRELLC